MTEGTGAGIILVADQVHTIDGPRASPAGVNALGVLGEVIVAVGSESEVRRALPDALRIELGGRAVVPGFTDAHCHWLGFALSRRRLQLTASDSLKQVLERVRVAAGTAAKGEWILGRGWDHSAWGRWPSAELLDSAAMDHPVALTRKDGHVIWVNSAALHRAGIGSWTEDPPGGVIEREAGRPTGVLKENAIGLLTNAVPPPDSAARLEALRSSWEAAWSLGITGCHDMGLGQAAAFRDLAGARDQRDLGLRFVWYAPLGSFDEAVALGLRSGLGDNWIRFGGIKVYLDGTLGSQTALLLEPYDDQPDNRGVATMEPAELAAVVARARAAGMSVAAHAIGDAAVRTALDHLGRAGAGYDVVIPDRIEHAQLVDRADLGRFASAGVVASMQPVHAVADADVAECFWGGRLDRAYPWRALHDSGARLVFGSDAPVEDPSVTAGLAAAVARAAWHPEQAVTVGEALYAYTARPAQITGQGATLGSLTPGKLADLAVLSADPFATAAEDLGRLAVQGTMIGGQWAWRHPSLDVAGPRRQRA